MNTNLVIQATKESYPIIGRAEMEASGFEERPMLLLGDYPLAGPSSYVPVYAETLNQTIGLYPLGGV